LGKLVPFAWGITKFWSTIDIFNDIYRQSQYERLTSNGKSFVPTLNYGSWMKNANHLNNEGNVMKKSRKNPLNRYLIQWVFLLIIFGWSTPVLCVERNTEEISEIIEPALIKSKGDNGVTINSRRYGISKSTIILDLMGKEIPLCDLPIPCEALVEYRMIAGQDPVCLRIEVKRLLEDSKEST
jgi:hypothetical protein